MKSNAEQETILKRIRDEVPDTPGVYLFYGPSKELLYIGKSIHLRQRMSSYLQGDTTKLEGRIRRLIFNIRSFEWIECASELAALLLEDELIKARLPPYNRKQKKFLLNQYLVLTDDAYPTLVRIDSADRVPARRTGLFGPFRDRFFVSKLLEVTGHYLHLRSCRDSIPSKRCPKNGMGHCLGPCAKNVSDDSYMEIVRNVSAFLQGDEEIAVQRMEKEMNARAKRLDFEGASGIRDLLTFAKRFCTRQQFIHRFRTGKLVILEKEPKARTYLFNQGRYKAIAGIMSPEEFGQNLSQWDRAGGPEEEDDRFLLDRANLVLSWLNSHQETSSFVFVSDS